MSKTSESHLAVIRSIANAFSCDVLRTLGFAKLALRPARDSSVMEILGGA
jgi:hypothetical protein